MRKVLNIEHLAGSLIIKYPNKLIFKVLLGSQVKAMVAAHSTFDLRNASQKNCSGE